MKKIKILRSTTVQMNVINGQFRFELGEGRRNNLEETKRGEENNYKRQQYHPTKQANKFHGTKTKVNRKLADRASVQVFHKYLLRTYLCCGRYIRAEREQSRGRKLCDNFRLSDSRTFKRVEYYKFPYLQLIRRDTQAKI